MSEGDAWAILWDLSGIPHVLESDSEAGAHELGARLTEQGRERVRIVGPCVPDLKGVEVAARLATLRLRLAITEAMGT